MEEEELQDLAERPVPREAQQSPSLGSPPGNGRAQDLDDANDDLIGRSPGAPLTDQQLARAAVLEQMAHSGAYRGNQTRNAAIPESEGQDDLNPMLIQNGYHPNPEVIRGAEGLEMVVYRPMPGSNAAPVVAFRGSQERIDWEDDLAAQQIGDRSYEANRALIDRTMSELSSQYPDPPEVTGHSLGGAIAQRTAADHPEQTGHITTFCAPGIEAEQIQQIEEYNRLHPDRPLLADHFRAEGDVVPWAGDGHAPGSVHEASIRPPEADFIDELPDGLREPVDAADRAGRAHMAFIATPLALETEAGREALPGIHRDGYYVTDLETSSVEEHDGPHAETRENVELARTIGGTIVHEAIDIADRTGSLDRAQRIGDASLSNADRVIETSERATDTLQAGVDIASLAGNAAVDDIQGRVSTAADSGHRTVNRAQSAVNAMTAIGNQNVDTAQDLVDRGLRSTVGDTATEVLTGNTNRVVDGAQDLARRGVSQASTAVDVGQQMARDAERSVNGAVDATQNTARSVVRTGQRAVNSVQDTVRDGQELAHSAWDWITA